MAAIIVHIARCVWDFKFSGWRQVVKLIPAFGLFDGAAFVLIIRHQFFKGHRVQNGAAQRMRSDGFRLLNQADLNFPAGLLGHVHQVNGTGQTHFFRYRRHQFKQVADDADIRL